MGACASASKALQDEFGGALPVEAPAKEEKGVTPSKDKKPEKKDGKEEEKEIPDLVDMLAKSVPDLVDMLSDESEKPTKGESAGEKIKKEIHEEVKK